MGVGDVITRANNAEYLRQLRVKAAAEGKCYQCRCRPTKVGCKSCQECLTRSAKVKEGHRGIKCRHCSVVLPPKRAGFIYCAKCADRAVKRNAARVQSLIASGLCGRCGRGQRHGESSQCVACLETMRLRVLAHYREAGVRPGGACSICASLGLPGLSHNRRTHDRYMAASAGWRAA